MRTWPSRIVAGAALAALAVAACGGGGEGGAQGGEPPAGATVDVELREFSVTPSARSAAPGSVTFAVENVGSVPHEFVVIRTDLAPDALPVEGGTVDEASADVEVVAETEPFEAGGTETVTANLAAGSYVLICNIPGHYQAGMTAAFTVG